MYLLDVNVLIARADQAHVHHKVVAKWFGENNSASWATCPLVQNAFLRILGRASYPNGPGSVERAAFSLKELLKLPGHQFISDDISLLGELASFESVTPGEITDLYLLALAVRHGGKLLTLDRSINPNAVPDGQAAYEVLGG